MIYWQYIWKMFVQIVQQKHMLFRTLKNLIKKNDLFYSNQMLRYENQMQYKSLTGGILSMALIITILIGFANMIILTLQREQISSDKTIMKHSDPPFMSVEVSPQNKFMMGFQIYGVNLSQTVRYFDYSLYQVVRQGGEITHSAKVPLQKCSKEHWSQLPQVIRNFDNLGVQNWVCPKIGYNLEFQGKYSSSKQIEYIFTAKKCRNASSLSACASQQDVQTLFDDMSNQFFLTFYYINPIINQNKRDYVSYYLQDSNYVIFGDKIGCQSYFYFSDYTVTTDLSIWPFQSIVEQKGSLIQNFWTKTNFQVSQDGIYGGEYAYIRMTKSSSSTTYARQVQKISTVFSFIGGMISAVSAVLFIIKTYNSQAFQIEIASSIFTDSPESEQLQQNNFWSYLKYNLYKFGKLIGCNSVHNDYNLLQNCLSEIGKQLDIKSLIQRIIFLEHCLSFLFQDYQLLSIQTKRPSSYSTIKKVRERCNQTESEITKEVLLQSSQLKSQSDNQSSVRNLDLNASSQRQNIRQKSKLSIKKENLFIDDIISQVPQKQLKVSNKVANCSILFQKQRASLITLQKNANKGDRVSLKIYNHLNEQKEEPKNPFSRFSTDK